MLLKKLGKELRSERPPLPPLGDSGLYRLDCME